MTGLWWICRVNAAALTRVYHLSFHKLSGLSQFILQELLLCKHTHMYTFSTHAHTHTKTHKHTHTDGKTQMKQTHSVASLSLLAQLIIKVVHLPSLQFQLVHTHTNTHTQDTVNR